MVLSGSCIKNLSTVENFFLRTNALEQCKPHQLVGILEVRYGKRRFLHRVIHTNVENFTEEKYLRRSSAEVMQCGPVKVMLGR